MQDSGQNNMNLSDAEVRWNYTQSKMTNFDTKLTGVVEAFSKLIDLKNALKNEANAAIESLEEDSSSAGKIKVAIDAFLADFEVQEKIESVILKLIEIKGLIRKSKSDDDKKKLLKTGVDNISDQLGKLLTFNIPAPPASPTVTKNLLENVISNAEKLQTCINDAEKGGFDKNNGVLNGRYLASLAKYDNATYNRVKREILNLALVLPPSSAIAGVYFRTNVWIAPANTDLKYVLRPTNIISSEDQEMMNVHSSGKSVNAIRSLIVNGCRTLDGNSNNWRYISVRRFFIFVEESVKKAMEQFLFQPNNANTWVNARVAIENFLTIQWRNGALVGSKPDQAFRVFIGLGTTMTPLDIQEGRMNITIEMAVVSPAEFIELTFTHKMQLS
jgi:hypothetical protein